MHDTHHDKLTTLLTYWLEHNQEHGAQINMFMGQQAGLNARWVTMPD